jgi:hypothetical protein
MQLFFAFFCKVFLTYFIEGANYATIYLKKTKFT